MTSIPPAPPEFSAQLKTLVEARNAARLAYHFATGEDGKSLGQLRAEWERAAAAVEQFVAKHDRRRYLR